MTNSLIYQQINTDIHFYGKEKCLPNYSFKGNNIREHNIIHFITEGCGTFHLAGKESVELKKGDIFLIPKGVPCFYQADSLNPWTYFWIGFSGINSSEAFSRSLLEEAGFLSLTKTSPFTNSLKTLFDLLDSIEKNQDLLIESIMYQMFYYLSQEFPKTKEENNSLSKNLFNEALSYIKENYQEGINVTDVSDYLNISRGYLYALFKKYGKISPNEYIFLIRMEKAKQLLIYSNHSLNKISLMIGYRDYFTFSKAFKKQFGITPSAYRK